VTLMAAMRDSSDLYPPGAPRGRPVTLTHGAGCINDDGHPSDQFVGLDPTGRCSISCYWVPRLMLSRPTPTTFVWPTSLEALVEPFETSGLCGRIEADDTWSFEDQREWPTALRKHGCVSH
jgi:hypothetical protein